MSGSDNPFDPFGKGDRTVIRPNPGGRRPAPPAPPSGPAQPQPAPYRPQPDADAWATGGGAPPPYVPPTPPAYPVSGYSPPAGYQPPPPPGTGPALILSRDIPMAANENPIMKAAGPLLLLLGRLRASLMSTRFSNIMDQVAQAIEDFEREARGPGINADQIQTAKYALAATADDIVQNIPNEDRNLWTQYSMLSRFFGERTGGVKFFDDLERMKKDPLGNYGVLELQYSCLAMGFQGKHRTSAGAFGALQQEQRALYEVLRKVRQRTGEDLSPRWKGQTIPVQNQRVRVPFWAIGSLAGVALFSLYLTYRFLLAGNAEAVAAEIGRLTPESQITVERRAPPAPVVKPVIRTTQLQRMRAAVVGEIQAGQVSVEAEGNFIVVRIGAFASFPSGQATVLPPFVPVAERLGVMIDKEKGAIRVVGHTDNVPLRTARFASNSELSRERAEAVAALLRPRISGPNRIEIDGKGPDVPIASNETVQGRALNRRVEIFVPRED